VPKEFNRSRRVGEQFQRELSAIIAHEITMPHSGLMVTISGVDVARDLGSAKVFITILPHEDVVDDVLKTLNKAAGFLRHELGRKVTMRRIPELRFMFDKSVTEGARLSEVINRAVSEDQENASEDE
jgi:ribosome-binding factor A